MSSVKKRMGFLKMVSNLIIRPNLYGIESLLFFHLSEEEEHSNYRYCQTIQ